MGMESSSSPGTASAFERANEVLALIRPAIQDDGGDVELVEITDGGIARIRLMGECVNCPSSDLTLHNGIERSLVKKVPEVVGVEKVD